MISIVMAAVLALTTVACSKGESGQQESGGKSETAASADYVYSAEQITILDKDGVLNGLNVNRLAYKDGRLYATGYSHGFSDSGNHILLSFAPDGSGLMYSMIMSSGMDDVIASDIGSDGRYYVVRVSYDGNSSGITTVSGGESGADGPVEVYEDGPAGIDDNVSVSAPGELPGEEDVDTTSDGPAGSAALTGTDSGTPAQAPSTDSAAAAPGNAGTVEEFVSEGDSPANDPALQEASTDGITSPEDELTGEETITDAEEELVVSEAVEVDPASAAQTGESLYVITCLTESGDEVFTAPVNVPANAAADYYVNDIAYCSEGVLVSGSEGLDLYSAQDGSFIRQVSADEMVRSTTPYVLSDGTVVVLTYGTAGEEITVVNLETGAAGESYAIPAEVGLSNLFVGKTYQLYIGGSNAVYGMNLDGSAPVKVIDFVDSDMDITAVTALTELEDGRMAAVVADQTGYGIVEILSKVDPEIVASRKSITLGSYYLDYEVRKQVFAFNKENPDVRISIVDYSQYDGETGTEGMTRLNTDIASGSAPDILVLSAMMPVKSYINKGVFEDLTSYMENDDVISGKEYLTNVFDAFKTDGKTYAIIPSFYVNTIVGKKEDVGDVSNFTLDYVDQLAKSKGVEPSRIFGLVTRDYVLYQAMEMCGDQFIDWDKSQCRFDSEEFIRLLEFISQFPDKVDDNSYQEDITAIYRNGKALFSREALGTFDEYVNLRYGIYGSEITLAGFPSQTPGTAVISPQLEIAVNASSDQKDACWSFVRRFLLDDYQNAVEMYWPVSIEALDQRANKAMEPLYYIDENGNRVEDHIIMSVGGENIALPRISDSEVDQMYAFLKGLSSEAYFDSSVENIIVEEAAAFFEGQKSAKDVASVIQSRVQIYINENS